MKEQEFDVVVVEEVGDVKTTTYFKHYSDYIRDKTDYEASAVDELEYMKFNLHTIHSF